MLVGVLAVQLKLLPYRLMVRLERSILGDTLDQNIVWDHKVKLFDPNQENVTTIMLGDSLTAYYDWNLSFKRSDIYNYGIAGDMSDKLLLRVSRTTIHGKTIFIMIGINDLSQGIPVQVIAKNIEKLILSLSANNKVYLQSTLYTHMAKINSEVTDLINAEKHICDNHECTFIDLNNAILAGSVLNKNLSIDDIHINNAAYSKWSDAIRNYLPANK